MADTVGLEAEKMRRIPGIVFTDGPTGRIARIDGTGLDVWEVILNYRAAGEEWERLREGFDWASEEELCAALAYYKAYPEEIDALLDDNARYTQEYVYERYPFARPSSP